MDIILWNDDEGRVVAYSPPGGMTAEEARADAGLVPQDRPTFIRDNSLLPQRPLEEWRLSLAGELTTVPVVVVPQQIPNWKAHAILKIVDKHDDVLAVIAAIPTTDERLMVQTAFERLDPLPRNSAKVVELLTAAGFDEAGIDSLFVDGNALKIDLD